MKRINICLFSLTFCLASLDIFAQVDTAWVRRYNGPGNGYDEAYALAVDDGGNVYVTGWSSGSTYTPDYATIKYAPNGDVVWVRRYNGPGDSDDRAFALVVNGSGNVYVTGVSGQNTDIYDYVTIKYAPNGDTLWVRRYNGPDSLDDVASALSVDDNGNVYVTGSSSTPTSVDWATIKYNPNGDTLWVRRYNGPGGPSALTADDSGNVYVTGYSSIELSSGDDYTTIKYAPNGDTLWVRRYNGQGYGSMDRSYAVAVDNNRNVYVTGESWGGTSSRWDYVTIKYAPNGDTVWSRRYNGTDGDDGARALAVDANENVYITGRSERFRKDYATVKYTATGDTMWVRRYNGPASLDDEARALVLDDNGNVYITGHSQAIGGEDDYATIKYAPNGDPLWVRRYNGPGDWEDRATALAVDNGGNVYVTGLSSGSTLIPDYATIKYIQFACVDTSGDANGDGKVTLPDISFLVDYVFKGGPKPVPLCRGDDNADGKVNLTDIIYSVNFVFKGGPAPIKSKECCL